MSQADAHRLDSLPQGWDWKGAMKALTDAGIERLGGHRLEVASGAAVCGALEALLVLRPETERPLTATERTLQSWTQRKDTATMTAKYTPTALELATAAEQAGDTESATWWRKSEERRDYADVPPGWTPEKMRAYVLERSPTTKPSDIASAPQLRGAFKQVAASHVRDAKRWPWGKSESEPTLGDAMAAGRVDTLADAVADKLEARRGEREKAERERAWNEQWRETLRRGADER